jgi:hypothetical protein
MTVKTRTQLLLILGIAIGMVVVYFIGPYIH